MMEDDDEAKLQEEIEAELDKISISSLEEDEVESDPKSDTESDDSDTSLDEFPESVLHYINIIKNKSKTVEELILQDLEEVDVLSCNYGGVANNHRYLKIGVSTENKENPDQLMKILSEIEKEEFLRSKAHCSSPGSVLEPHPHDLPMDEHITQDDGDINFGYCEVEERCRQSFEAWRDKQKELEDKEKEILKAQREREEKQFQEEEEKRHCWMKQFEIEKKKLENIQKEEQDKINDELHKEEKIWKEKLQQHEEFIRSLHLQMEEERTRLKDLQETEKIRLLKLQNDAAIKIQAKYKAFVAYQKYGPIIKEQLESRRKKAQEWKEMEAKIRQMEAERQKRLEEEERVEEEIKRQKQEEKKRREKDYEEKKNILKQEREELRNKEKLRLTEDAKQQLIISSTLKKENSIDKYLTVEDKSKNKCHTALKIMDENLKQEDVPLEESNETENVDTQLILKELVQSISNQTILSELKMEGENTNPTKIQCSEKLGKQEREYENINENTELENPDPKENVKEQFQLQELNSQIRKEKNVGHDINKNVGDEIQVIIVGHSIGINEVKNKEVQKIITGDQQREAQKVENEEVPEHNESLHEENNTSLISMKEKMLSKLEKPEDTRKNLHVTQKQADLKSREIEDSPEGNALNSDFVIFNATDALRNTEGKTDKQDYIVGRHTPCEDLCGYNVGSSLVSKEVGSQKAEVKEIPDQCNKNTAECENVSSGPESTLLSSIEEKRLAWMKSCKPWFKIFSQNQQKKIVKRRRPVKCAANRMPPLSTLEILQYGSWNTLQQVTTVTFQDLPGCNLSPLAECTNLQFLSLRRCGLTSLHGLGNCHKLKYIDAQENHIETINCENLENLCVVLLNKNQLTSFHGLDGCTNIQNLEVSHNKITRIGGLESLKNLQQLIVDHNQLISTKGLCDTPTIIHLDCSYNHLTDVEGIDNCGLLQILKLQGNYLSELPSLDNHVLLRELYLDDNSISAVEAFSSYWLPLLQNLTISQNSLTKIAPLFHFVSLEKIDFSNNCLSDLTSLIKCFEACYSLRELSVTGNPLLQEINWRHSLLEVLPSLQILNGDMLSCYTENHPEDNCQLNVGCFLALCQTQIQQFNLLVENHITGKGDVLTLDTAENLYNYFKKLMTLSNEYRYAHEHGDVNIAERDESKMLQNRVAPACIDSLLQIKDLYSCANKQKQESLNIPDKLMNSGSTHFLLNNSSVCEDMEGKNQEKLIGQKREDSEASNSPPKRAPFVETVMTNSLRKHQNTAHSKKTMAAVLIQAHWRGYIMRKKIKFSTWFHTATTGLLPNCCIKNQTILKKEKRKNIVNTEEQRKKAAILIQAVWKGFILRKKLTAALEAIRNEESEEEYEEIDLEDFTFDEASLEKEWLALDSTRFPSQTPLLSNQLHRPKISGTLKYDDTSLNLPSHPAQAWLCNEKENVFSSEHPGLNSRSENRTLTRTSESKTNRKSLLKSEKEEKISEEWGFKNIATAQQMLKRAQKMKSKKLKKKIDPTVRLTLFKSNENRVSVTKSPKKARPRRVGYFQGKEDSIYEDTTANEKLERRREYTYQWLHTQVGVHETTSSRNMKCSHFLPELDPDVLNGGRVQLMARLVSREDTDLDLFSMTSGSALSVNREKKSQAHRHSAGSSSKLWFPSELI
ncbi:leucine-rich repeat and IQ domain-containing protein 1 isoform X2 [Lepus europaeus]|uniref:leucine-rich repeat and IQ domain-containing protein 1 isoform X2 n=1 Tax=Lepus europaeus TaxID=9983 RepID=UPI002B45E43A|nr:leucine-rich repeat and IQ domain-containing protein 1 isoform X2 [Lepus europaeus]